MNYATEAPADIDVSEVPPEAASAITTGPLRTQTRHPPVHPPAQTKAQISPVG
jgi:hypothetical protein